MILDKSATPSEHFFRKFIGKNLQYLEILFVYPNTSDEEDSKEEISRLI